MRVPITDHACEDAPKPGGEIDPEGPICRDQDIARIPGLGA